nr:hydantoinase B/oxoprolinase family protein [uncultured Microbacterium sp.]
MSVNVITAEVVRNGMAAAAAEMFSTMIRTAHSPLLYASRDFGVGIVSADGQLWGSAPGVGTFVTLLSHTVRHGLTRRTVEEMKEGDYFIVNDPYITGTHISDTTIYSPIVADGRVIAFSVVTAHWLDIGGKSPGGWCGDSTDVYQEGMCFTHEKLIAEDIRNPSMFSYIENNVRFPKEVFGDLEAQISACRQGAARVHRLSDRYGAGAVEEAMRNVIRRTDEAVRRKISALPDGVYSRSTQLDGDGVEEGARPVVALQLNVEGDRIRLTFDGSTPTARGPINHPGAAHDVYCALKGFFAPNEKPNEGHSLPFSFDVEPGLVVSPVRPAPTDSYGFVGVALIELAFACMSDIMPEATPASGYQLFGGKISRSDARFGEPFNFLDLNAGGAGARPTHDGPSLIFSGNGDTPTAPIEVIETRYPLRCLQHSLIPEFAGHGRQRGGQGVRRDFQVLGEGIYTEAAIQNSLSPLALGAAGGEAGHPSVVVLNPDTPQEQMYNEQGVALGPLTPGDVVSWRTGGGGGYGRPSERRPDAIAQDIREGRISQIEAREVYGYQSESESARP